MFAISMIRDRIEWLLEDHPAGEEPPPWPPLPAAEELERDLELDPAGIAAHLEEEGQRTQAVTAQKGISWNPAAEARLFHLIHDTSHHMMDVSRLLAPHRAGRVGRAEGRVEGQVEQINVSDGGVPKLPVASSSVTVGRRGLAGDRQGNRKHHGRPFQAVCLWSTEVLADLVAAGHPIYAGAAGENLTVSGLDWTEMRAGTILRFETNGQPSELELELSWPATPCHHQVQWFTDGDYKRIDHDENPGSSRWYAWVRRPGPVAAGDRVVVPSGP